MMTEQEAIEVLKGTQIFRGRNNGKTLYVDAVFKAIQALKERERRKELIEKNEKALRYEVGDIGLFTTRAKIKALKECEVEE